MHALHTRHTVLHNYLLHEVLIIGRAASVFQRHAYPSVGHSGYCAVYYSSLQSAYDKAVPLYDRALKIYEENLSADHPTVLSAMNNRQLALDLSA